MSDRTTALALLRAAVDDEAAVFRDGQWEAIDSIVNRRERLLVVERTGWGKSSVYFIATRMLRNLGGGPTLIVSPLLALMRNQIQAAERLGIRAVTINSTNTDDWPEIQRTVRDDEADALLVSPERLANDTFVDNVLLPVAARVGLLVVDEAHCISDWGHQAPGSIVAYYQQVGRAGRGVDRALGIVLSGVEDAQIHEYFRTAAFPKEEWVTAILKALDESDGLSVAQLESPLNLRRGQIEKVLKFLSVDNPAPVVKDGAKWLRTPVAWRMDHERIQRLTRQRETEWREVQAYIDESGCLMVFLARALDDPEPTACGQCASCRQEPVVAPTVSRDRVVAATRFLRSAELPLQCRKQIPKGRLPQYAFSSRLAPALNAEIGRVLSRWGDAGWGAMVADDKQTGHFRDDLADAAADMLRSRWRPDPPPRWVACVPSYNRPMLVSGFAQRLAAALALPFAPVVHKVKHNAPQKEQQNAAHQCRNLDGAFAVRGDLQDGPVLLVDDIVDSGWTLTVVAALLRQAGCPVVWPLALATSNPGA